MSLEPLRDPDLHPRIQGLNAVRARPGARAELSRKSSSTPAPAHATVSVSPGPASAVLAKSGGAGRRSRKLRTRTGLQRCANRTAAGQQLWTAAERHRVAHSCRPSHRAEYQSVNPYELAGSWLTVQGIDLRAPALTRCALWCVGCPIQAFRRLTAVYTLFSAVFCQAEDRNSARAGPDCPALPRSPRRRRKNTESSRKGRPMLESTFPVRWDSCC